MANKVFVLDTGRKPLDPVHSGYARRLLKLGEAAVLRRYPFTIILKRRVETAPSPLRLKCDPGSQQSGMALVNDATGEVVFAAEIEHRGQFVKKRLDSRRAVRRSRRQRKTRYRKPRFLNRTRPKGWLPPSLESRVENILTWTLRFMRLCPIQALSQELVKFDMQKMEQPEIAGVQYQQGTLAGYELREYLLEKWKRKCAYCGSTKVPLQVEHIVPRANGGTDRASNLTVACEPCNTAKGKLPVEVFLKNRPNVLKKIQDQAKAPLKDAAAVNATRWKLFGRLKELGLPLEVGSGGLTKFNRTQRNLPKRHWLDAACVGNSTPENLHLEGIVPLQIKAMGHGQRQMCRMDRFGFPRTSAKQQRVVHGFKTGDFVRASVTQGKKTGTYLGRVAVRSSGSFNIRTAKGTVQGISFRYCKRLHQQDGYTYSHS